MQEQDRIDLITKAVNNGFSHLPGSCQSDIDRAFVVYGNKLVFQYNDTNDSTQSVYKEIV